MENTTTIINFKASESNPEEVTELKFTNNLCYIFEDEFKKYPNTKKINFKYFRFDSFPIGMQYLTKLEEIEICTYLNERFDTDLSTEIKDRIIALNINKIRQSYPFSILIDLFRNLKSLSLAYNKIKIVPANICELNNLEELDLSNNELSYLPQEFEKRHKLRVLNIEYNKFSAFPEQIAKLEHLRSLNVSSNRIRAMPNNIGNLTNLESIELQGNDIEELCYGFVRLQSLKYANLSYNPFKPIPIELGFLKKLVTLKFQELRTTALFPTEDEIEAYNFGLKKYFKSNMLNSIQEMKLFNSSIDMIQKYECLLLKDRIGFHLKLPKDKKAFYDKMFSFEQLKVLHISNCALLPFFIQTQSQMNLEELFLEDYKCKSMPIEITSMISLKKLIIKTSYKMECIPDEIEMLVNLTVANLQYNKFSKSYTKLLTLNKLHELNLGGNEFKRFPIELALLPNLEQLSLNYNKIDKLSFTYEDISHWNNRVNNSQFDINENMILFPRLKNLHLFYNELIEIPESIKNCHNLVTLNAKSNKITKIAKELLELPKLCYLNLSKNKIEFIPLFDVQRSNIKNLEIDITDNSILEVNEGYGIKDLETLGFKKFTY